MQLGRCDAQNHELRLVSVKLQAIPQEPGANCCRALTETLKSSRGVGRVESNDKLYVISEFVVHNTVRADEITNWRHVCCEK